MIGSPFIPSWDQLRPFVAELWLIAGILAVLLAPFFTTRQGANRASATAAGLALVAGIISLLVVRSQAVVAGQLFQGMLISDWTAVLWKLLLMVFALGVLLLWASATGRDMHSGDGPEFFALLLGATLGMCLMASTSNLLMLVMAVEMASLPSYVLAGFRKTHRVGSEASLKYVLFGAAASSIMVYGISLLYGLYGTLHVDQIAAQASRQGGVPLMMGIAGLLVGIGFKISVVPLHFWCPDVFEGAAMDVSAFLSVASKGAGLVLLLRLTMSLAAGYNYQGPLLTTLAVIIGVMGSITATVGNTGAFVQNNMKRLLAYSSIAHAGYMLCALSLLARPGGSAPAVAAGALLLYLAVYLFMNLGAFTVAGLIHRAAGTENIEDYAGLGRRNPLLALCMAVCLLSLVGLPPLAGFGAKVWLMKVLGDAGGWWWVLVAVIGLNTIASLYYYARVLRVMYLQDSQQPPLEPSALGLSVAVVCSLMLVLMLVGFNSLLDLASGYGQLLLPRAALGALLP